MTKPPNCALNSRASRALLGPKPAAMHMAVTSGGHSRHNADVGADGAEQAGDHEGDKDDVSLTFARDLTIIFSPIRPVMPEWKQRGNR